MQTSDPLLPVPSKTRLSRRTQRFSFRWRRPLNILSFVILLIPSVGGGYLLHEHFYPSNQTVALPIRPQPQPGYYASFSSPQQDTAIVLLNSAIKIVRVNRFEDLPFTVRSGGNRFSTTYLLREADGTPTKALLLSGDVDIDIDQLGGGQSLAVALAAKHGDVRHVSIAFSDMTTRGPPPRIKPDPDLVTVFVVGHITSFSGPKQFKDSLLLGSFVDLSGTDSDYADYIASADAWARQVRQDVQKYGTLPDSELWAADAETNTLSLHLRDGNIYPDHGTEADQEAFRRKFQPDSTVEPGEHESERPHPTEIP